ncbi:MAG: hypothetical protein ACFE95_22970 [Candidatus Hodarchaeota archaeon]
MFFPFSLQTPSDWLEHVPHFLHTLSDDSEYLNKVDFHQYLAAKLESFFSQAPGEFLVAINMILTEATVAGKYVLLETLILAENIWPVLAQDVNLQPTLTELALSTDRLYSKSAAQLSSRLEEIQTSPEELETVDMEPSIERIDYRSDILDDTLGAVFKERKEVEKRKKAVPSKPSLVQPPPPPGAPSPVSTTRTAPAPKTPPPSAPAGTPPRVPPAAAGPPPPAVSTGAAPSPTPAPAPRAVPPSPPEKLRAEMVSDLKEIFSKMDETAEDEAELEEAAIAPADEPSAPTAVAPVIQPSRRIHTHVHYFARMNPRKTYPFIVTLSSLARKIARDRTHFLSGEKEAETRGEFEVKEEKLLMVEPLLSGCLVQPTFQFIDLDPVNLPLKLKFFITPLVEPGFRSTPLQGSLFIKNEEGSVLYELPLPELSVTSGRISQLAAAIGIVAGGAMPAFDTIYGTELQAALVAQLTQYLGSLAQSVDMWLLVQGAEILTFTVLVGGGLLWWLTKGRAKEAPDKTMAMQLPQ